MKTHKNSRKINQINNIYIILIYFIFYRKKKSNEKNNANYYELCLLFDKQFCLILQIFLNKF